MALARYDHQGGAVATTLSSSINSSDTSITIAAATSWPTGGTGPFYIAIDRGLVGEERILIQSRSGTTLTVAASGRGKDGTTAAAHSTGAAVEHIYTALEADDTNAHIYDTSRDDHTQLLNTTRHDVTARHTFGAGLGTPGAASASAPGDSAAAGVGSVPARSDHTHGRTDAFGTPAIVLGTAAAAGSGSTLIRSNSTIVAFDATAPTTSAVADAAATGSAAVAARRDHVHGREAFGSPVAVGMANANGSATTLARSDHVHQPAAPGSAAVTTNETTTSATYTDLTTTTDTVTITTGTHALVILTATLFNNAASSGSSMSFAVSGATTQAAGDATALRMDNESSTPVGSLSAVFYVTLTAGSNTFKAKYKAVGGTAAFSNRQITVIPLP